MRAVVQSGGRSPKPLNGPTPTTQLKPGSDSVQNSVTFLSQIKGKKRERGDQGFEPIKRERHLKTDDGDSCHFRQESILNSEISKIIEKGGLVDSEGVEKLVQFMQPDRAERKIDLAGRIMLADVIAATDRFECLGQFVQLRGLSILDEWLQEVHKGKISEGSPKDSDKSAEEFLFALLRALDKLPVNLHALQTCNVGKSINHLRSHKNLEIQKKARSLVDTWKKGVEAEMNINDVKSGSSQAVSWPSKAGFSDVSHAGNRRVVASSEVSMKSSITQPSTNKAAPVKLGHGDGAAKSTSASPGYMKIPSPASVAISSKDSLGKMAVSSGTSDMPLTMEEEKSSSSSLSQNNSQSCSSDCVKTRGSAWKQDAKSSTTGSRNVSKKSIGVSRQRRSSNGILGSAVSGVQKETAMAKSRLLNRKATSEKMSQPGLSCEGTSDMPVVDYVNSQRLIVKLPNSGRSPERNVSGVSFDEPCVIVSRALSPGLSEKHDQYDRKVKENSDPLRPNITAVVNTEYWQSNDVKDGFAGSDEGGGSPAVVVLDEEHCRSGYGIGKPMETSRAACSSLGNDKVVFSIEPKSTKSYDNTLSSITALIESCVKHSEADACVIAEDDLGMNPLNSVAAGEMSKSDLVSLKGSLGGNSPMPEDSYTGYDLKSRLSHEDVSARSQEQSDDGPGRDAVKLGDIVGPLHITDGLPHVTNFSGDNKTTSFSEDKPTGEHSEQFHTSSMDLQQTADPCSKSDVNHDETTGVSVALSCTENKEVGQANEDKKVEHADERTPVSNKTMVSDFVRGSMGDACNIDIAVSSVKDETEAVEESLPCPSLEMDGENKKDVPEGFSGSTSMELKVHTGAVDHTKAVEESSSNAVLTSGSGHVLNPDCVIECMSEKDVGVEAKINVEQREITTMEQAFKFPPTLDGQVGGDVGSVVLDHGNGDAKDKSETKEQHNSGGSALHEESPTIPVQENGQYKKSSRCKLSGIDADETEECASTAEASPLPVVEGLDIAAKLDFDLNEGFSVDEENTSGCLSAVHVPSPLSLPVSPMSSGLPASITVAAAAKRTFVPLENLLKSKGELGWKASGATSAFWPAEPRKVLEMPFSTTDIHIPDTIASKQVRRPLDIDLNVPDERVHEEMVSHCSAQETSSQSGFIGYRDLGHHEMFGSAPAPVHNAAGLDLDLNRVDEDADIGQLSVSNICRSEVPLLPVRLSSSGGFPNGEVNALRDFDLNNGSGLGEVGTEPIQHSQHVKSRMPYLPPVAGLRLNNTELGSLLWFPPGNSYRATAIPSILPDRGEQPYPIVATTGLQRILGPPNGGMTFGHDIYRGPVLSSSPALAFSPVTPFPYPGFHFSSSFPIPAVSSHLVSSTGAVSSHYPRPYVISVPDCSTNGVVESSRKLGREDLDLNAGPGGTDMDRRDERIPSASRHLSIASSHAPSEEQVRMSQAAGGALKRRESEGALDEERFSYKQPSW